MTFIENVKLKGFSLGLGSSRGPSGVHLKQLEEFCRNLAYEFLSMSRFWMSENDSGLLTNMAKR